MTRTIMAKRNNPNGANQWVADPRQELFLSGYLNPKSETWSNALQSALKAGYTQEYADNIMALMPTWLSDAIGDNVLLQKASRNLGMALEGHLDDQEKGGRPLQYKATEFVLKGLQKNKWGDKVDPSTNNIFIKEIIINKANESNDKSTS